MTGKKRKKQWTSPVEKEIRMQAGQKKRSFGSRFRSANTANAAAGTEGYEAFISYRHLETDVFVAENLHKLLEHYTIPKSARKLSGAKHIRHIFRDRDELPISADLSASITDALRRSSWLIVICTPQTSESMWVKKEIETFLQTHSRDRIILVLADGEPEQSFPREVRFAPDPSNPQKTIEIEPLAADVRGSSNKERLKKMKEEKLRIMAALLQVPYDSLVQRDRDYRLKRTVAIGTAVGSCVLAFGIYTSWQNMRIRALYNETNQTLAKSVAETASAAYGNGDREGAIELLLSAADEKGNLLSPVQMYPLANMMNTYRTGTVMDVYPADYVKAGSSAAGLELSASGNTAAWKGDGGFQFYDLENRKTIREVPLTDLYKGFSSHNYYQDSKTSGIRFLDDETALIYAEGALFKINIQNGDILKRVAVNGQDSSQKKIWQVDITGDRLTVAGNDFLKQYDLSNDLKEVYSADFGDVFLPDDMGMSVNPESGVISLVSSRLSDSAVQEETEGIFLADPAAGETGALKKLSDDNAVQSLWLDPEHLITLSPASEEMKKDKDGLPVFSNQFSLTTWKNGEKLQTSGPWSCTSNQQTSSLSLIHLLDENQLALCSDFRVYFLNPLDHSVSWQSSFADEVNGVYSLGEEERFLIKTGSKNISVATTGSEASDMATAFPLVESDNYSSEEPAILWTEDGYFDGVVTLSYSQPSRYLTVYRSHTLPETGRYGFPNVMDVQFSSSSAHPSVLAVGTEEEFSGMRDLPGVYQAVVFDEESGEKRLEIECQIDADGLQSTGLKPADTHSYDKPDDTLYPGFRLVEQDGEAEVVWTDGTSIFRQKESDSEPRKTAKLNLKDPLCTAFSQNGQWAGIDDEDGFHLYQWSAQSDTYEEKQVLKLSGRVFSADWTADQNYLVLMGKNWIRVWDLQKGQWVDLEESVDSELAADHSSGYPRQVRKRWSGFRLGKEKPLMLVARTNTEDLPEGTLPAFLVYDLSTGKCIATLDEESLNCQFGSLADADQADFSQHDSSLILNFLDSNGAADELICYSLKDNAVTQRQECPESIGRTLLSHAVLASADSPHFALTKSGGYIVSRSEGLRTGKDAIYTMDEAGFYPLALLDSDNAYFSSDMTRTVQGFDSGFILQPVLSAEELSQKAKDLLKEAEARNSEQQPEEKK